MLQVAFEYPAVTAIVDLLDCLAKNIIMAPDEWNLFNNNEQYVLKHFWWVFSTQSEKESNTVHIIDFLLTNGIPFHPDQPLHLANA